MRETRVRSLGGEDLLEEGMATHSSILRRIPGRATVHEVAESDTTERLAQHSTYSGLPTRWQKSGRQGRPSPIHFILFMTLRTAFAHSGSWITVDWLIQSLKNPLISSHNSQFYYLGSEARRSQINPLGILTFDRVNSFPLPPASPLNCHELVTSNDPGLI